MNAKPSGPGLTMPAELHAHWVVVLDDYFSLRAVWDWYSVVYRRHRGLISDVLRLTAEPFLSMRGPLRDGVALGIARLLDPPTQQKCENLVLDSVIELAAEKTEVVRRLESQKARISAAFLPLRNKVLAHRDRGVALGNANKPAVSDIEIDEALEALFAFVNTVAAHFEGSTYAPRATTGGITADDLFDILGHGLMPWWRAQLRTTSVRDFLRVCTHFLNHLTEVARQHRRTLDESKTDRPEHLEYVVAFEETVEGIARIAARHIGWADVRAELTRLQSDPLYARRGAQDALAAALVLLADPSQ